MTTLTIPFRDDLLQKVDEFAKKEERSREELVDEAIEVYLRRKALANAREWRRGYVEKRGLVTEDAINEEIRAYREEKRLGKS